jgi:DNA-directed RNA polymerase specialized sigma24 family protein
MADLLAGGAPRDSELVRAAQVGDVGALGLLFARHRAGMYAVSLALLGHSQDAEDAVQEAALIALRRIGDIRDPDAVGPWLRMVVRNACRAKLRKTSAVPMADTTRATAETNPAAGRTFPVLTASCGHDATNHSPERRASCGGRRG